MTFLSSMCKEKTRKVFEDSKKAYGDTRLGNSTFDYTTKGNIEDLIKLRNESRTKEYGMQSTLRIIILLIGFVALIFFLMIFLSVFRYLF